jgi:gliding motility-associated-like protein
MQHQFYFAYSFLFALCFSVSTLHAQAPSNDDCSTAIDLGVAPKCDTTLYTNKNATKSVVSSDPIYNTPTCWVNNANEDVWFKFTAPIGSLNWTIKLKGAKDSTSIKNPEIALYRGSCDLDDLDELSCAFAQLNEKDIELNALGLTPGLTYFIRINAYTLNAKNTSGAFSLCIEKYVSEVIIGTALSTTSCSGTLYDTGGSTGDYQPNEYKTFKICPSDAHKCIALTVENHGLDQFGDHLRLYAGADIGAPLITDITGQDVGKSITFYAASQCVFVEFTSDPFTEDAGFKLKWACSSQQCGGSSVANPTLIPNFPFTGSYSTCDNGISTSISDCDNDTFLNGPQYVFAFPTAGGICAAINITGAPSGTGVLVLNGPPSSPTTKCVRIGANGYIPNVSFDAPGTYYIIVANAEQCTPFNIKITPIQCILKPSLENALCNPINGCAQFTDDGAALPSIFYFEDGFQDIPLTLGVNNGCWLSTGLQEPNYYWFTMEAQDDGKFGFLLESGDEPSDIDFNVWGPFQPDQVCKDKPSMIAYISTHQPIRSSYAAGPEVTGLTDKHPLYGYSVTDEWDCDKQNPLNKQAEDDVVKTIKVKKGEVYVVLANDYENKILKGGIKVDWSPSTPSVLIPKPIKIVQGDTSICKGDTVQLALQSGISSIEWLNNTSISCQKCLNPLVFPQKTTVYKAWVKGVCLNDTLNVKVRIFEPTLGKDATVCRDAKFQLVGSAPYNNATYNWSPATNLSCSDCPQPTITTPNIGNLQYIFTLNAKHCSIKDTININVLPELAPTYQLSKNQEICIGTTLQLGDAGNSILNTYEWTSSPTGFTSNSGNPSDKPTQSTKYQVLINNSICPLPTKDSVFVTVYKEPILNTISDTSVCQGDKIRLGSTASQEGVSYQWLPSKGLSDATVANPTFIAEDSVTYTLIAKRGVCTQTRSIKIKVKPARILINNSNDTLQICRGTSINLSASTLPNNAVITWLPTPFVSNPATNSITVTPELPTLYTAQINTNGCIRTDKIFIQVDSLPKNLLVLPKDTSGCKGAKYILRSELFEPSDYPSIKFKWLPSSGQLTPDSLFNLVVQPTENTTYLRIATSGVCVDTQRVKITVLPTPTLTITPSLSNICLGESVNLTTTVSSGMVDKYEWKPKLGLTCSDCANPTATPTATQVYTVLGTAPNGCPGKAQTTVNVSLPPTYSFPTDRTFCTPSKPIALGLNNAPNPKYTYTWKSSDLFFGTSNASNPSVTFTQSTTYFLTVTNGACTRTDTVSFNVFNATVEVTKDTTVCEGSPVTLIASGTGNGSYEWQGTNSTAQAVKVTPTLPLNVYTLVYTYGNGKCKLTKTVTVKTDAKAAYAFPSKRDFCGGEKVDSIALNTIANPAYSYVWTSEPSGFNATTANPKVLPTATTSYFLTIKNGVCSTSDKVTISIGNAKFKSALADQIVCPDVNVVLAKAEVENGINANFSWQPTNSVGSNVSLPAPNPGESINYVVRYQYNGNCFIYDTMQVSKLPFIKFNLTSDSLPPVIEGLPVVLTVAPTPLGATYQWFENEVLLSTTQTPTFVVTPIKNPSVYRVQITTKEGCVANLFLTLATKIPNIQIPTIFTPDGTDPLNKIFTVLTEPSVLIERLQVYSRWGELVFEKTNLHPNEGWDGTHNNTSLPSDVYIYRAELLLPNKKKVVRTGDVTLLR